MMGANKNPNALGNNLYFDYKMGAFVALIMGVLVFFVNFKYEVEVALIAALKQVLYTFLFGGVFIRLSENLATHFDNDILAVIIAVVVAAGSTILATYLVHSLKGTPEPFESSMPTILGAPPSYAYWAIRKRKQLHKLQSEENSMAKN